MVDKNRVEGAWDKAKGAVKEGVGKVTGDNKLQAEGKADKVKGKVREHLRWRQGRRAGRSRQD